MSTCKFSCLLLTWLLRYNYTALQLEAQAEAEDEEYGESVYLKLKVLHFLFSFFSDIISSVLHSEVGKSQIEYI